LIKDAFGASTPFSLGVEEEVMILDAETFRPVAGVKALIADAEELTLPGVLKTELHASIVELNTHVCDSVDAAIATLAELRESAAMLAGRHGWCIAAAAMHPTASAESLPVVQEERYLSMLESVGQVARMQGVSGLHVHVGVASRDECYAALEAVLPWLPVVLALSSNSPFLEGRATGMWSNRAPILAALPRAGAPPCFGSYAAWEEWVETLVRLGVVEDYTRVWWDVRPHPKLGTIEIRIPDQPTELERTKLLVTLIRDLVENAPRRQAEASHRGDYAQNRWAAARYGLDAELIHPDGDSTATARELAAELLGQAAPEPEAARQLELGPEAACADLVARTVGSAR
jgi:glutamate---cysteine ligase / carboxylate-amine ligase